MRRRNGAVSRRADDIVIFKLGCLVLLGISCGLFTDLADIVQLAASVNIGITRNGHQRIASGCFWNRVGIRRIVGIGLRNPIVHNRSAWVDGEGQLIAQLRGQFHGAARESAAWPNVGDGRLVHIFLACTGYPECKTTKNVVKGKDDKVIVVNEKCEKCGAPMRVCRGKRGAFLGCSRYPACKSTKPVPKGKPDEGAATGETAAAGDGTAAPAGE